MLPFPPPGDLPNPSIRMQGSCLHHWQVDSLPLSHLATHSLLYVTFLFVLLDWVQTIVASDSEFQITSGAKFMTAA